MTAARFSEEKTNIFKFGCTKRAALIKA